MCITSYILFDLFYFCYNLKSTEKSIRRTSKEIEYCSVVFSSAIYIYIFVSLQTVMLYRSAPHFSFVHLLSLNFKIKKVEIKIFILVLRQGKFVASFLFFFRYLSTIKILYTVYATFRLFARG